MENPFLPNNLTQFIGFSMMVIPVMWSLIWGLRKFVLNQQEKTKLSHVARMQELADLQTNRARQIDAEIEIAKTKQFSLEQIAGLLKEVKDVHMAMDKLKNSVSGLDGKFDELSQSEKDHKVQVEKQLDNMDKTVEKLQDRIMDLLMKGPMN